MRIKTALGFVSTPAVLAIATVLRRFKPGRAPKRLGRLLAIGPSLVIGMLLTVCATAYANEKSDETTARDNVAAKKPLTFNDDAKAIFRQRCVSCHNANKTSGDLDLSNYGAMMQGSSSGDVIEPGSADDSYLLQLVTHESSPEMPPDSDPIPDLEIEVIRKWINAGAIEKSGQQAVAPRKKLSLEMGQPANVRPAKVSLPNSWPITSNTQTIRAPMACSIASSPWAPIVAVAAANQVVVYDATTGKILGVTLWESGKPKTLRFSRDGSKLLVGGGVAGGSGHVVLLDVESGEPVLQVGDELDAVLAADISASLTKIATGGPERVVRVYDVETESLQYERRDHTDWVTAIEFSPDGLLLASGDRNGGIFIWEAATGEEVLRLAGHKAAVTQLSWRLDSKSLASSSESGKVTIWEAVRGKAVKSFNAHNSGCLAIAYTRDGRLLSGGRDKNVLLWDGKGKQLRKFSGLKDIVVAVGYNDETNCVFGGDFSGKLFGWDAANGKLKNELKTNPAATQDISSENDTE